MNYRAAQAMLQAFNASRVAYHLACAVAAAHEDNDKRRDEILALMTDDERRRAREARQ